MRDFRYLRVVEHRLVGFLQSPGGRSLYEIYENHEGNKREKRNSEEKLHVFLFFSTDQNLLRDITAKVTLIFRLNFA